MGRRTILPYPFERFQVAARVNVPVQGADGLLAQGLVLLLEGSEPLLGAVTLEEMGLGVDPLNQRLVPVTLLLAPFQ